MRMYSGLTIETQQIFILAQGNTGKLNCVTDPDGCCEASTPVNSCCPDGAASSLDIVIIAPVGLANDDITFAGTLTLDNGGASWTIPPTAGSGGLGAASTSFSATLYCTNATWVLELLLTGADDIPYRFMIELSEDSTVLYGEVEIDILRRVSVVVESPCSPLFAAGECAVACGCVQISTSYSVRDETDTEVARIYLLNGQCVFQSKDANIGWSLELDGVVWRLRSPDNRNWTASVQCCNNVTFISSEDGPDYSIHPLSHCCGDGTGTGTGTSTSTSTGPPSTPITNACCGVTAIPSTLTLTLAGTCGGTFTLTYNAAGANGAGWYSVSRACGGNTVYYFWKCVATPLWNLKQYCNGADSGTGAGGTLNSCSPFSYTGGFGAFSGACSDLGPSFSVTA